MANSRHSKRSCHAGCPAIPGKWGQQEVKKWGVSGGTTPFLIEMHINFLCPPLSAASPRDHFGIQYQHCSKSLFTKLVFLCQNLLPNYLALEHLLYATYKLPHLYKTRKNREKQSEHKKSRQEKERERRIKKKRMMVSGIAFVLH